MASPENAPRQEPREQTPPENNESTEKNSTPQPPSRVVVLYNGILSNKLDWEYENFDTTIQKSDLRSRVVVKNNSERPKSEITKLGDTLARKGTEDAREIFFGKTLQRDPEVTTTSNFSLEKAEIILHDEIISERITTANNGKFNETAFIQELNKKLRIGLNQVILEEKKEQAKMAAQWLGVSGLLYAPGVISIILGGVVSQSMPDNFFLTVIGGLTIMGGAALTVNATLANTYEATRLIKDTPTIYFNHWNDLNPLSHMTSASKGIIYNTFRRTNYVNKKETR